MSIIKKTKTIKKIKTKNKTKSIKPIIYNRPDAISWILHSMKNTLGYENIRAEIIKNFYPEIKNPEYIKTFDAFIEDYNNNKKEYKKNYNKKIFDMKTYFNDIMSLNDYVVFSASNIEEYIENGRDIETHYQTFICDNTHKILYCIDPALKPRDTPLKKPKQPLYNNTYGIYVPMIAINEIMPFYKKNGYNTCFISLSHAAQTNNTEEKADVFCQSWSIYILLKLLENSIDGDFSNIIINIPEDQNERYDILLNFYKNIIKIPIISETLNNEYLTELENYNHRDINKLNKINPSELLLTITPTEI